MSERYKVFGVNSSEQGSVQVVTVGNSPIEVYCEAMVAQQRFDSVEIRDTQLGIGFDPETFEQKFLQMF